MIKYDLRCTNEHVFEAWFRDSNTCDRQLAEREVACTHCGSVNVQKTLMAPAVAKKEVVETERRRTIAMAQHLHMMREFRQYVEQNSQNVGTDFPEEARRIHYGEADKRSILGEADLEEANELIDEGVEIFPIPGPFREDA